MAEPDYRAMLAWACERLNHHMRADHWPSDLRLWWVRHERCARIKELERELGKLRALEERYLAETPSAQPGPQATDPERVVADLDDSIPHPAPQ